MTVADRARGSRAVHGATSRVRARATVVWRTQAPFLLTLLAVAFVGTIVDAAPLRAFAGALGIALVSLTLTVCLWPRGGDLTLVAVAVLQMIAVAFVDYTSWDTTPSMMGLMMLPALYLSYGFRARAAPFVVAVAVPPVVTGGVLLAVEAPSSIARGAVVEAMVLAAVATVVFLSARRSWLSRAELEQALVEALAAANTAQVVADAIGTGVTLYDSAGKVEIRNQAMTRLLERAVYDESSRSAEYMYHSDRTTPLEPGEQPSERMLHGEVVEADLFYLGPPGDQRAVTFTATKLSGVDGPAGFVLVAHDVTDLVNAVTTREEMILTFTHELRTPLTSIIGFAETLQDGADLEALGLAQPVEVIHRNATHLSALVQMLIQAGTEAQARLHPTTGDILDIVRETLLSLSPRAEGRSIILSLDVRAQNTQAVFDSRRVRQALENLVSNALKFSAPGGTTRIVLHDSDDAVEVQVIDDGPGIEPQDFPQLFQRGFRSVNARRTATQGMGLGLAIARDIARAHGGDITASSNAGPGATFTLTLPRHPKEPQPRQEAASGGPERRSPDPGTGARDVPEQDSCQGRRCQRSVLHERGAVIG